MEYEGRSLGVAPEFEPPEHVHIESIVRAITRIVPVAERVVHRSSSNSEAIFLRAKRLEGWVGDWTWPLVSRALYARIQMRDKLARVEVALHQTIHRADVSMAMIDHSYELESVGRKVITYRHSLRVLPEIEESFTSEYETNIAYNQSIHGGIIIEQDLGENQELRAGDCDYLFDEIASFWPDS